MQPESQAWQQWRAQAGALLPANFADRVLREARLERSAGVEASRARRIFLHPFSVSAATAALSLLVVVLVHAHNTQNESERRLADWQEIAMETAALDPL